MTEDDFYELLAEQVEHAEMSVMLRQINEKKEGGDGEHGTDGFRDDG